MLQGFEARDCNNVKASSYTTTTCDSYVKNVKASPKVFNFELLKKVYLKE
jgi:hypothetical protein